MAEVVQQQEEVEISGPAGTKFKARGSDILGIIQLVALTLITYGGYLHTVEAKDDKAQVIRASNENTNAIKEMVNAQREANCLNRLTAEQKKQPREIEFCMALGRGR